MEKRPITKIFLLRHGEAEGNLYRRCQGQSDAPLTANGRTQLRYVTERFAPEHIDAAYASDLSRARETAEAAVAGKGIEVVTDKRLREMCFGEWENRAWGNINDEDYERKVYFLTDPDRWSVPGAETFPELQARLMEAMTEIASRHVGQTVVVGCHGMAIRAFFAKVRGVKSENIAEIPLPGNCSVSVLEWEDGAFRILSENDVSHMPVPPYMPFRYAGRDAERSIDLRYTAFDTENGRELYLSCYRDAWQCAHGDLRGFDAENCWRAALTRAADSPYALRAGWRGDYFAGLIALDEKRGRSQGVGWIAFLYVVPKYRRQRAGLQLVGEAMWRYRSLGRTALRLSVAPSNPALGFYEKLGFVRVGEEPGAVEPLYVMEKKI